MCTLPGDMLVAGILDPKATNWPFGEYLAVNPMLVIPEHAADVRLRRYILHIRAVISLSTTALLAFFSIL